MKKYKLFLSWLIVVLHVGILKAQDTTKVIKPTEFTISAEFKARLEVRNGYRTLVPDDTTPSIFVNNRTRLNLDFKSKHVDAYISLQDARVWGEYGGQYRGGSINLFEGYAEVPLKKGFSVKLGRQRIMYDNQRLFAQNDWRVWARSHDALRFNYKKPDKKLEASAVIAYNQSAENFFGSGYTPKDVSSEDYKLLNIFSYKQKYKKGFSLFLLHAGDGFESTVADQKKKLKMRYTTGGRIEWEKDGYYLTLNSYIQYGKTTADQKIIAWYAQPEFKITALKNTTIRIGGEFLSGQNVEDTTNKKFNSFVPLYGVAHRFNGFMDQFTKFPGDTKSGGLLNPYLFIDYKINDKISISENIHYFSSHHNLFNKGEQLDKGLGFENDILFKYQPHKIIGLEAGYSFLIPTEGLEYVKNTVTNKFNQWAYLQITITPEFFKYKKQDN